MKRTCTLILIVLMLFVMVTGCTTTPTTLSTTTSGGTTGATTGTTAATTTKPAEPVTITLLCVEQDFDVLLKDTPNFKKIQQEYLEKFNVIFQLETALPTEFDTVVTTRFASGTKLPDMINHPLAPEKLMDVYDNGLIIRLNDLIKDYGPDVAAAMELRPYLIIAHGDQEGNILRVPGIIENPQHRIRVLSLRQDWVQAVNMEQPKTTADFYALLKAFQTQDVNGSGAADEVFYAAGMTTMNRVFAPAFGIPYMWDGKGSWYYNESGKIYHTMLTDETKEYVTYINKLFTEKLLDNDFMNPTAEAYNVKLYNNQIAARVGYWWDGLVYTINIRNKGGIADADCTAVMPPLAKDPASPKVYNNDIGGTGGFMITKDCAAPEQAMQIINWGYTIEGTQMNYYGEVFPGGDYYEKAVPARPNMDLGPIQMQPTAKMQAIVKDDPALASRMGWNKGFTTVCWIAETGDIVAQEFSTMAGGMASDIDFNINSLNDATGKYAISPINLVFPTVEQSNKLVTYGELFTYMDEMMGKFMTGAEPIANWDAFVAQCHAMDIDGAIAIIQTLYDAYTSIVNK